MAGHRCLCVRVILKRTLRGALETIAASFLMEGCVAGVDAATPAPRDIADDRLGPAPRGYRGPVVRPRSPRLTARTRSRRSAESFCRLRLQTNPIEGRWIIVTTRTVTSQAALPGSTIEARHAFYSRECGISAVIDPSLGKIVLEVGDLVGAVTMPRALGLRVDAGLGVRMLAGPVISQSRIGRWIFLTGPGGPLDESTMADFFDLGVAIASTGDFIKFPSPEDERLDVLRWERIPRSLKDLPPQSAVIATTRAMAIPAP